VLRYHGETPPTDYEALSRQLAARTGVDAEPFVRVVRHVRGQEKLTEETVTPVLAGYLAGAQRLAHYLDQQGAS
jgi:hypothetical protein